MQKIYTTTLTLTAAIMVVGTGLCLAVPDWLMSLFTDNGETIRIGTSALHIICAGFVVSSVSVVSSGALEGMGMGFPSLMISLCRYVVVLIPAAFVLSRMVGAEGVWHAFWLTEAVAAAASFLIYREKTKIH